MAIGEPIPGMGLHLVGGRDADEGEIAISGPQLACGYWRDSERTARAFRTIVDDDRPIRAYFTGDWAERHEGSLYFRQRIDFQVKVHGFRLELDEVAAAIRECGWPNVCVVKCGDSIAAVVEHIENWRFDERELQTALALRIEPHGIPTIIRMMQRIPRNENDKMDLGAVRAFLEGGNLTHDRAAAEPELAPPNSGPAQDSAC
jgi:D-alanine--poly(phosphoribitol) ligase subunit 1